MEATETGLTAQDKEWKEARYECITCTDIGPIMGVHSISRRRLLESKIYKSDPMANADEFTKRILEQGKTYEEAAREAYKAARPGATGFVPSMHVSATIPWFTGTPDYLIPDQKTVVEFKTHHYPTMDMAFPIHDTIMIPDKYYLQVQGYIQLLNYDHGVLFSWTARHGWRMFFVGRDDDLWSRWIYPRLEAFYHAMVVGKAHPVEMAGIMIKEMTFKRGEKREVEEAINYSKVNHCMYLDERISAI